MFQSWSGHDSFQFETCQTHLHRAPSLCFSFVGATDDRRSQSLGLNFRVKGKGESVRLWSLPLWGGEMWDRNWQGSNDLIWLLFFVAGFFFTRSEGLLIPFKSASEWLKTSLSLKSNFNKLCCCLNLHNVYSIFVFISVLGLAQIYRYNISMGIFVGR